MKDFFEGLGFNMPDAKGAPKASDAEYAAPPPGVKPAHPDQLFPDIEGPYPDMSPEGETPHISEWIVCGDMFVCYIDGKLIRNRLHIDYVEGGHFLRYAFIPENQIWIEDVMEHIDQCATVIHESHEHFLMSQGISYEDAHASASKTERDFRNMVLEKGTVLPDDDDMAKFITLELQGASCLQLSKEIMESKDSAFHKWVESTGKGQ